MVTAKAAGRKVGSVLLGAAVVVPLALVAAVPVALGSIGLAIWPHKARFERLHKEIREDLEKIDLIRRTPGHTDYPYYERQVAKYLRPTDIPGRTLKADLPKLIEFFQEKNLNQWSYSGMESPCKGMGLFIAFGHAAKDGIHTACSTLIRIAPKAFHLPNHILAGVMVHEATHFVLGTDDIAYDATCWPGHEYLKELPKGKHYLNADNWRIFYQKMRKKVRP